MSLTELEVSEELVQEENTPSKRFGKECNSIVHCAKHLILLFLAQKSQGYLGRGAIYSLLGGGVGMDCCHQTLLNTYNKRG